jgi:hypothetical protein
MSERIADVTKQEAIDKALAYVSKWSRRNHVPAFKDEHLAVHGVHPATDGEGWVVTIYDRKQGLRRYLVTDTEVIPQPRGASTDKCAKIASKLLAKGEVELAKEVLALDESLAKVTEGK